MHRIPIVVLLLTFVTTLAVADKITITSNPSGAVVEIDGVKMGTTPFEMSVPGGYLHGTKTAFGKRLGTQSRVRVSLKGYAPQEVDMARGPYRWVAFNGNYYGDYWILKTDHFHFDLQPVSETFTGSIETSTTNGTLTLKPELSVEQVVAQSTNAVLVLKRPDGGQGTGFFITETGVIATNAHVAQGTTSLIAISKDGQQFDVKVVHVDETRDLAILKAEGHNFPHLKMSNAPRVGQTAIAIGNPGYGMQNSVTKGIVSAVGNKHELGNGTWLQTDASINPGNSGGPLLNSWGEVIGVNSQKIVKADIQGINYALSSADLLIVLAQYYPNVDVSSKDTISVVQNSTGKVQITSVPDGADVFIDNKFVGNTPSSFSLSIGTHKIQVKSTDYHNWERIIEVMKDSEVNLKATLEKD